MEEYVSRNQDFLKFKSLVAMTALAISGCSLDVHEGDVRMSLEIAGSGDAHLGTASLYSYNGANPFASMNGNGLPTSAYGFDCFVVNVVGRDIAPLDFEEHEQLVDFDSILAGGRCSYAGVVSEFVSPQVGGVIELIVPSGPQRVIQVLGVKSPGGCPIGQFNFDFLDDDHNPNLQGIYELGRTVKDLFSQSEEVYVANNYDPSQPRDVRCKVPHSIQLSSDRPLIKVASATSLDLNGGSGPAGSSAVISAVGTGASATNVASTAFQMGSAVAPYSSIATNVSTAPYQVSTNFTALVWPVFTESQSTDYLQCEFLAPYTSLPCNIDGVNFSSQDIQSGPLKMKVYDPGNPYDAKYSSEIPTSQLSIRRISNLRAAASDDRVQGIPGNQIVFNNILYFVGFNSTAMDKLHSYNDSSQSLTRVVDIGGGALTDNVGQPVLFNGALYFRAGNTSGFTKLFRMQSNGIVTQISNIASGSNNHDVIDFLTVVDSKLFFAAKDGTAVSKVYSFDGTQIRKESNIRGGGVSDNPTEMVNFLGKLYFVAEAYTAAAKLYRFNGASLQQVSDNRGATVSDAPMYLTPHSDGYLYFSAKNTAGFTKLHRISDNLNTIQEVTSINSSAVNDNPTNLFSFQGKLYFSATVGSVSKLYVYNGGNQVTQISNTAGAGLPDFPTQLMPYNNLLLFVGRNSIAMDKLYAYNPVANEVMQLSNTSGIANISDMPGPMMVYNNNLYFGARNTDGVTKLFMMTSDFKMSQVSNTAGIGNGDNVQQFIMYANKLFFMSRGPGGGGLKLHSLCDPSTGCTP